MHKYGQHLLDELVLALKAIRSRHHVQTQGYSVDFRTGGRSPKIQFVTSQQVKNLNVGDYDLKIK